MSGIEVGDIAAEGVAADAGSAEMDSAEDAGVSDFRNGAGEAGERARARTRFGSDGEGGVVSENGSEDGRC